MPTNHFDCQLLNETAEMSYPVFSQTRENMHPVEKDGYHFEGAPLGDRSVDRRYSATVFFLSGKTSKGAKPGSSLAPNQILRECQEKQQLIRSGKCSSHCWAADLHVFTPGECTSH